MSRPRGRRIARRHVVTDKHNHWEPDVSGYEVRLFELAAEALDEMLPRPSQQLPNSGHRRTK